jgi:hypothetical protein
MGGGLCRELGFRGLRSKTVILMNSAGFFEKEAGSAVPDDGVILSQNPHKPLKSLI